MRVGLKELNPDRIDTACYLQIKLPIGNQTEMPITPQINKLVSYLILARHIYSIRIQRYPLGRSGQNQNATRPGIGITNFLFPGGSLITNRQRVFRNRLTVEYRELLIEARLFVFVN
ncbi:hypothetical protein V6N12_076098 [Hibiscus sabdariffa]|uniref:Uncharacterized protein n=1 Tax=Hibiscus sabdariffa TaxID=183260 RepID=A0ABR2AYX0_9ROSI